MGGSVMGRGYGETGWGRKEGMAQLLEPATAEGDDQNAEDKQGDDREHSPVDDAVEEGVDDGCGDDYKQGDSYCEGEDSGPGR